MEDLCKHCGLSLDYHEVLTDRCPGFIKNDSDLNKLKDMTDEEQISFWLERGTFFEPIELQKY